MIEHTFQYDDIIRVTADAPKEARPGEIGWIVGIYDDRSRFPLEEFEEGTVYLIEFEDGQDALVHERHLKNS